MALTEKLSLLLADYTTFRLGGPCAALRPCGTPDEVCEAVRELSGRIAPYVFLGGGSNVLVSDAGIDASVIRFVQEQPHIREVDAGLEVDAGTTLDDLASFAAGAGLEGLMCCTGIPGTVGGAIVGNAGAWGRQIADVLESVTLLDSTGNVRTVRASSLGFAYRRSALQQSADIVLSARFALTPVDSRRLEVERQEILAQRAERHPDLRTDPCIGSFFRNIEPTSAAGRRQAAGWYLEQAGAKQMSVGGACVFDRHANIIIKGEGCTAQDVRDLACLMQAAVREKFELELVREVRFLGRFRGEDAAPVDRYY